MVDRAPTKPNRYAVYDENHNFIRYEYHERADEPTQAGDALNKANLLPDTVATALGLTGNPQVKDAMAKLSSAVSPLQYVWDKFTLTEQSVTDKNNVLLTNASTQEETISISYGDGYYLDGSLYKITNPTTILLSYSNYATYSTVLRNKYFVTQLHPSNLYKGKSDCTLTPVYEYSSYRVRVDKTQNIVATSSFVEQVTSYDPNEYPQGGVQGGYQYIYIGRPPTMPTKIEVGSYTGTGTYGSGSKNSLTLDFAPKKISIINSTGIVFGELIINGSTVYGYSYSGSFVALTGSISGNTISWYAADAAKQLNASGVAYIYVAEG